MNQLSSVYKPRGASDPSWILSPFMSHSRYIWIALQQGLRFGLILLLRFRSSCPALAGATRLISLFLASPTGLSDEGSYLLSSDSKPPTQQP